MNPFLRELLASAVRHGLTVAAGALATAGYLSGDQSAELVASGTSLALLGASLAWSYASKKLQHK